MPKGSRKKPKREDEVQSAVRIMETIAERSEADAEPVITDEMRAIAAAFGRMGGLKGGPARAAKMTKKQKVASAKKAAAARWKNR